MTKSIKQWSRTNGTGWSEVVLWFAGNSP